VPVTGYRLWTLRPDGLYGAKQHWSTASLDATCLIYGAGGEIPHTDGRCGRLGCGVYAAKHLEPLLS
jgi:hypothetical protein